MSQDTWYEIAKTLDTREKYLVGLLQNVAQGNTSISTLPEVINKYLTSTGRHSEPAYGHLDVDSVLKDPRQGRTLKVRNSNRKVRADKGVKRGSYKKDVVE